MRTSLILQSTISIFALFSAHVRCSGGGAGLQEQVDYFNQQHENFIALNHDFWAKFREYEAKTLDGHLELRKRARILSKYMSREYMEKNIRNIIEGEFIEDVACLTQNWADAANSLLRRFPLATWAKPRAALIKMRDSPIITGKATNPGNPGVSDTTTEHDQNPLAEDFTAAREKARGVLEADTREMQKIEAAAHNINEILTVGHLGYKQFYSWFVDEENRYRTIPRFPFSVDDYLRHILKEKKNNAWWKEWMESLRELRDDPALSTEERPQTWDEPHDIIRKVTTKKYLKYAIAMHLAKRFSVLLSFVAQKESIPPSYLTPTGLYILHADSWTAIAPYSRKAWAQVDKLKKLIRGEGKHKGFGVNVLLERALKLDRTNRVAHRNAVMHFEKNLIADGLPRFNPFEML